MYGPVSAKTTAEEPTNWEDNEEGVQLQGFGLHQILRFFSSRYWFMMKLFQYAVMKSLYRPEISGLHCRALFDSMTIKREAHLEPNDGIPDLFRRACTPPEVHVSRNNAFETTDCRLQNFNQETMSKDY
jgi:hypothetical protein